jgi:hypothetical protein
MWLSRTSYVLSPRVPFQEQPAAEKVLEILAVVLRTTKINTQKFYMVLILSSCVLYGYHNKQRFFSCTALFGFCNRDGECLLRGTEWVFIYYRHVAALKG